jgi:hypothetical protein
MLTQDENPWKIKGYAAAYKHLEDISLQGAYKRLTEYRLIKQLPHELDWLDGYTRRISEAFKEE